VALSATSKNQTHPYLIHDGPVSDEAAWTVPELCKAYEWPNDLAGGGTIALIHLRGGWLPGDITKFFAAQGLAGKEPKVTDHSLDGAAADNGNSSAPNEAEAGAALDEADAEVALRRGSARLNVKANKSKRASCLEVGGEHVDIEK
jgi:hypothetical protein